MHHLTWGLSGDVSAPGVIYGDVNDHNHSGAVSAEVTDNLKKVFLRAWTKLSNFGVDPGMIAFWEGDEAPPGYHFLDGTDGYPDLRDHYIVLCSTENTGQTTGDGTTDIIISAGVGDSAHGHKSADQLCDSTISLGYHDPDSGHTHTAGEDGKVTDVPYRALHLIIKTNEEVPSDFNGMQEGSVYADIDAQRDDGSGTYTGDPNALIERPDHFFKHVWKALLGGLLADLDSSFTTAGAFYAANPYALSHVIREPIRAADLFAKIAFQCRSKCFMSPYGKLRLIVRQLGQPSGQSIVADEIKRDSMHIERSAVAALINYFNIYYDLDFSKGRSVDNCQAVKEFTDSASVTKYGQKEPTDPALFLFDAVSLDAMAEDVGDFYLEFQKMVRKIPQCEVFLDNMEVEQGDIVDLTHPLDSMSGFACEVIKILHVLGSGKDKRIDRLKIIAIEN